MHLLQIPELLHASAKGAYPLADAVIAELLQQSSAAAGQSPYSAGSEPRG
jgi:hypothetical protein